MKRIVRLVMLISLFAFLLVPAAFAKGNNYDKIYREVQKTDQIINSAIVKAQFASSKATEEYKILLSNAKDDEQVQEITTTYNNKIVEISEALINVTGKTASKTLEDAQKFGVNVSATWVEVALGDKIVLVDPLLIYSD